MKDKIMTRIVRRKRDFFTREVERSMKTKQKKERWRKMLKEETIKVYYHACKRRELETCSSAWIPPRPFMSRVVLSIRAASSVHSADRSSVCEWKHKYRFKLIGNGFGFSRSQILQRLTSIGNELDLLFIKSVMTMGQAEHKKGELNPSLN